ncbi:short-subunit dehydrogenase [Tamaricihabitans halophyticus]|uniref:Short-subunit dehydrogenase n=1 Tax=Tamaricihabitans halophyticus TaxID=1262583 RepID=A0A4V2SR55_9PSEU|nr:SDR family NAD(P)-dependent oxidoreductase [Tamaricihabitans halophyticus]TCP41226.1 short-subunit dehydrogenase [Tamaricihabitans halophyticus]
MSSRVAIVTGAGAGLGRAYALDLARAGLRLVVNDRDGTAAARVAGECHEIGVEAESDESAVGALGVAGELVGRTLERFGRVDALVCNAGVVRDRTVHRLTDMDVQEVLSVHLGGVIDQVRAVWPHFRRQRYGRVVLVSSAAGLFGSVGQANYAAAKAAVVGLGRTLAAEGRSYDIAANVVAPVAQTDMAMTALGDAFAGLSADDVAPLVTYLCSEGCMVSGELFAAGGGRVTRIGWAESAGVRLPHGFTAADIAAEIDTIRDMSGCAFPADVAEHLKPLLRQKQPQ